MILTRDVTPKKVNQTKGIETGFLVRSLSNLIKRSFDFTMALFGLIILAPVFAIIAFLIKRDSPGPVIFWGRRMGKNGRPFNMGKFRTMQECQASYQGPRVTCKDDDRITPLGRWLRETKINELPQLWNVLKGEMSLVGPRPEDPEIVETWQEEARTEILSVRPGITSPASIVYHDEEKLLSKTSVMDEYFKSILPAKMRLDQLYVYHRSFISDLDVIFWTMAIFIPRLAKTRIPEGYLFAGPISRLVQRYINWFLVDSVICLGAVSIAALLWHGQIPSYWGNEHMAILAMVLAFLFSGLNSITGINRILWSKATTEDALNLLFSSGTITLFILALDFLELTVRWLPLSPLPAGMIITIGLISQIGFVVVRYRLRLLTATASRWLTWSRNTTAIGERVLIVGAGDGCQIANWLLSHKMFRAAFFIVGMIDDNHLTNHGMRVNGCWILGGISDVSTLVKQHDIGVILSTIPAASPKINEYIFDLCRANHIRLIFLDDLLRMVDQQITRPTGSYELPMWLDEPMELKATHDPVTGLPNRYLLQDLLKRSFAYSRRYHTQQAVMFIELDEINAINEILGRKCYEMVLKEAAKRLIQCERSSDTLARIGEDKFALILENIADERAMPAVARRIYTSFSEPFVVEARQFRIGATISISLLSQDPDDLEILKNADIDKCYSNRKKIEVLNQHEDLLAR